MKITVFAHTSYEAMFECGKSVGLSDTAADMLAHFEEIELHLDVNEEGEVLDVTLGAT